MDTREINTLATKFDGIIAGFCLPYLSQTECENLIIVFQEGETLKLNALYAAIPFKQHSKIPADLGCELTEMGHIKTDSFKKTTIAGIYACGDNTSMMRAVSYAVATGGIVGSMVNKELVDEVF